MITFFSFFAIGALSWVYYTYVGALIQGGFTIWIGWFFAVLCACGIECFRKQDLPTRLAWMIMALGWSVSMFTWKFSSDPLLDLAAKNLLTAAFILFISLDTPFIVISLIHVLLIFLAWLSFYDFMPGARLRPKAFIAWSYPDVAAGLQHVCLIVLGAHASGYLQKFWSFVGLEHVIGYGYNRRIYSPALLARSKKDA